MQWLQASADLRYSGEYETFMQYNILASKSIAIQKLNFFSKFEKKLFHMFSACPKIILSDG